MLVELPLNINVLEFRAQSLLPTFSKNVILLGVIIMGSASTCLLFSYKNFEFSVNTGNSPNAEIENIFLLILTAIIKIGLTAYTFGMMVNRYRSLIAPLLSHFI